MSGPLNVLIVEDFPDDAELMLRELRLAGWEPRAQRVETRTEFTLALQTLPDVILADYSLPNFDAAEALKLLQDLELDIPFIVVTGFAGEDKAVACMKNGAADYLLKDRLARLAPAVGQALAERQLREGARTTQAALRASEERYRAISNLISDFAYSLRLEPDGTLAPEWATDALGRITGYGLEDLAAPGGWARLVYPADLQGASEQRQQALAGQPTVGEYRIITRSGDLRWLREYYQPVWDSAGNRVQRLYGAAQDITDRRQAEETLRLQAMALEALAEGVAATDQHSIIIYTNLAFDTMFGYQPGELLGRHASVLHAYPPEETGRRLAAIASRLEAGETWQGELQNIRKDGTLFLANVSMSVLNLPNTTYRIMIHEDVTERRRAEAQSRLQLEQLGALYAIDRTINADLDLQLTLHVLLDQLALQPPVDAAAVLLFDPSSQSLNYRAGRGFLTAAIETTHLRLGECLGGRAAQGSGMLIRQNLNQSPDFMRADLLAAEGFVAYLGVPLTAKGGVLGVLEIFQRAPRNPDPEWFRFLETLCGQTAIAITNAALFDRLHHTNRELSEAYDATIEGWSRALDLRDRETEGHTQRVTELALRLARIVGTPDDALQHIRWGALLHDIGKMGIPDGILLKPGPLSPDEWDIMRLHPGYALQMLQPITYLHQAIDIPYCHHEKWDGSGYPRGLKGADIPTAARIFAVVDVYDALLSDRPYRPGWPLDKAIQHIRDGAGSHFDPQVTNIFLDIINHSAIAPN